MHLHDYLDLIDFLCQEAKDAGVKTDADIAAIVMDSSVMRKPYHVLAFSANRDAYERKFGRYGVVKAADNGGLDRVVHTAALYAAVEDVKEEMRWVK